ncbi:MAG: SMP-30/gluconolactonase/LRE family protein [Pseudomonadota bacterium]
MNPANIGNIGRGLVRPEGVMCDRDGTIFAADARGMVARVAPDGRVEFHGDLGGAPNGLCLDGQGGCIVANIGAGMVQLLKPDGTHDVLFTQAEGRSVTTPNFPCLDSRGRLWVSNSTQREDVEDALRRPAPDGAVILYEDGRALIAAEGIMFANGLALDEREEYLYVAATMERAIIRFGIGPDGRLRDRRPYGPVPLARLGFPDGVAFDEAGNLWVTFPAWNAVGYITPDQELKIVIHDPAHMVLGRPTNICFGWEKRQTAFIGSLDGRSIPFFQVDVPGLGLRHQ